MYRTITVVIVHSTVCARFGVRSWLVDNDAGQYCMNYSLFETVYTFVLYCIVLYCIMRPYTDGPIGPLPYRYSSGVVRNPHSALAE